jgi:hypothetical protein
MKLNLALFLGLLMGAFLFVGCDSDDDHNHDHHDGNEISIQFFHPAENEVVSAEEAESLLISLEVVATDENHDIYIELYPAEDASDKILDFHVHLHNPIYTFDETVDISEYPSGTTFVLYVRAALDHDGDEHVESQIEFSKE